MSFTCFLKLAKSSGSCRITRAVRASDPDQAHETACQAEEDALQSTIGLTAVIALQVMWQLSMHSGAQQKSLPHR